ALLYGTGAVEKKKKKGGTTYEGVIPRLERMLETGEADTRDDDEEMSDGSIGPEDLGRFVVTQICETCGGSRLRSEALAVKIADTDIAELSRLPLQKLRKFLDELLSGDAIAPRNRTIAEPLV